MENNNNYPIGDPRRIYCGMELFFVTINKADNHKTSAMLMGINYAAVDSVKVKEVCMNDQETGLIVNKSTKPIQILLEQDMLDPQSPSTMFDQIEKAAVVAKVINKTNYDKAAAMVKELTEAVTMLKTLVEKGA